MAIPRYILSSTAPNRLSCTPLELTKITFRLVVEALV